MNITETILGKYKPLHNKLIARLEQPVVTQAPDRALTQQLRVRNTGEILQHNSAVAQAKAAKKRAKAEKTPEGRARKQLSQAKQTIQE